MSRFDAYIPALIAVFMLALVLGGIGLWVIPLILASAALLGMARMRLVRSKGDLIYRISVPVNAKNSDVNEDLDRLYRFASERSRSGVVYVIASMAAGGRRAAYIVVSKDEKDREGEILEAFAKSLKVLRVEKMNSAGLAGSVSLPLPRGSSDTILLHAPRSMERWYPGSSIGHWDRPPAIMLGYSVNTEEPVPVGLEPGDIYKHISVFGSTGSGKTTTAARIALEAVGVGLGVIIIDWHDEYADLLPGFTLLDPCGEPGLPLDPFGGEESIEAAVDIVEQVLGLTAPQTYMLHRVLEEHGGKMSIGELTAYLGASEPNSGYWEREVRQALLRRLHPLIRGARIGLFKSGAGSAGRLLRSGGRIVRVGCIDNVSLRRLYVMFLLKLAFEEAVRRRGTDTMIIVDEAHNVFQGEKSGDTFTDKLIAESRKYRLGFLLVTQSPSSISPEVLKNTGTKIIHAIHSGLDKRVLASSMALNGEYLEALGYLRPGEAVVQTPSLPEPVIIRVIPPSGQGDPGPSHHVRQASPLPRGMVHRL